MHQSFLSGLIWALFAGACAAQDLRAVARVEMGASGVTDARGGAELVLALTQAVPYRIYALADPMRIVVEFREVRFQRDLSALDRAERVDSISSGPGPTGWSRLVLGLSVPMGVETAALETDPNEGTARVRVRLRDVSAEAFAAGVAEPEGARREAVIPAQTDDGRLIVAVDPGHGGVDPGAQRDGYDEADLMLQFARVLKEALLRAGIDEVVLTRDADQFVSLPARVSIARAARADLLISLHADALAEGRASGTTVYTLSQEASDRASAILAERQDRQDILAGVDLRALDDQIATVLMDLARAGTAVRTERLATEMVTGLRARLGELHKRPRLQAGFSVLKAPDIPSVLIELGFMSSEVDLRRLTDPVWRGQAAEGIVDAVIAWHADEEARK